MHVGGFCKNCLQVLLLKIKQVIFPLTVLQYKMLVRKQRADTVWESALSNEIPAEVVINRACYLVVCHYSPSLIHKMEKQCYMQC